MSQRTLATPGWTARSIEIDGARIHYVDVGQGEPVLLLHGYPQSHRSWRHQIDALSGRYRVIAPDWFGFGQSERRTDVLPSYDAEVDRIGQFATRLGVQRFNLIAHDYGAHLGLGFVIRHADRVLRLAILNSRAHGTFRPAFYTFSLRQHWFARQRITRTLGRWLPIGLAHRRAFRRYVELGCFSPELLEEYVGWMDGRRGREWYFHFFTHYYVPVRPELAPGLPGIRCPTAVVWGDRDPYIPLETARELAARIPNATLSVLHGADHFVMEERPSEVSVELQRLLARPAVAR